MSGIRNAVRKFTADESGAALVEYGILIALIAVICVIVVTTLGETVSKKFSEINQSFN